MENNTPETNNFLNWVEIKNFKSIKDLRLDCKRVNVFIGKPNVGKSNILEGLGLLGASYSEEVPNQLLKDFVRFESFDNLFYDNDVTLPVEILSDKVRGVIDYDINTKRFSCTIGNKYWFDKVEKVQKKVVSIRSEDERRSDFSNFLHSPAYDFLYSANEDDRYGGYNDIRFIRIDITDDGGDSIGSNGSDGSPIKRYEFEPAVDISETGSNHLLPPHGGNLFNVIDHNKEIRKDIAEVFRPNGLNLVLSKKDRNFSIQKQIDGYVYDYPYSSIADTFQRYTFYLAAIESNKNSVIIFEEPEVHSFPPYVKAMAHRMVNSETNQFFVSTHSPYLLQTLISELDESELAVYITYYQDYQTHVRQLTAEELQEAQDLGIDLFYNLSRYEPNA